MSDVRTVYTTAEVAEMLQITSSYLLRFSPAECRRAGKRNYLFSQEAVEKLKQRKQ